MTVQTIAKKEDYLFPSQRRKEKLFILWPPFLITAFVLLTTLLNLAPQETNPFTWLLAVVFIDVAHVWSTLFRTYLSREGQKKWQRQLILVPLFCYLIGVFLHALGPQHFWRVLAYFAVFHFVRQQFGLYRLYDGKETSLFDKVTIYSCPLIPLLIWHFNGPQDFSWFVPKDFWYFPNETLAGLLKWIGPSLVIIYLLKETLTLKELPLRPKHLIVLGTFLSWWTGIVWMANDWAFTLTNVIAHGMPYFGLIALKHFNRDEHARKDQLIPLPSKATVLWPLLIVCLLAFFEEGLWDILMWRDHPVFYGLLYTSGPLESFSLKALIVPLLALPQATHYALDGFIWRRT